MIDITEAVVLDIMVAEVMKHAFALFGGMSESHRCAQTPGSGATWDDSYTVNGSTEDQQILLRSAHEVLPNPIETAL
jgi:hypothetical protein